MTSSRHISLRRLLPLICLAFAWPAAALDITKSAADYFHGGAMAYLTNNIPAALDVVSNGLVQFPDDEKLKKLEELLKQQQQQNQQDQQDQNKEQNQDQKDQQNKQDQKQDQQKQQSKDQKKDRQQSKQDQQIGRAHV